MKTSIVELFGIVLFTIDFFISHTRKPFRGRSADRKAAPLLQAGCSVHLPSLRLDMDDLLATLSNADRFFGRRLHAGGRGSLGACRRCHRLFPRCKTSDELPVLVVARRRRWRNGRRTSGENKLGKSARLRIARRGNCWREQLAYLLHRTKAEARN